MATDRADVKVNFSGTTSYIYGLPAYFKSARLLKCFFGGLSRAQLHEVIATDLCNRFARFALAKYEHNQAFPELRFPYLYLLKGAQTVLLNLLIVPVSLRLESPHVEIA